MLIINKKKSLKYPWFILVIKFRCEGRGGERKEEYSVEGKREFEWIEGKKESQNIEKRADVWRL